MNDKAIYRYEIEFDALHKKLPAAEGESVVTANAAREAERAVSEREFELSKLSSALEERSTLADLRYAEIVALRMQVKTLQERLERATALEDRLDSAVRETERPLSKNASESSKLTSVLEEHAALADSQKVEIVALKMQVRTLQEWFTAADQRARAVESRCDAVKRALSDKETEIAKLRSALDERSALADSQKAEVLALRMRVRTLQEQFTQSDEQVRTLEDRRDATVAEAQRALSEKHSELVRLTSTIDERSALADLLNAEIAALRVEVYTSQERLTHAVERTKGLEDRYFAAMREAEVAATRRETELSSLMSVVDEQSAIVDLLKVEVVLFSVAPIPVSVARFSTVRSCGTAVGRSGSGSRGDRPFQLGRLCRSFRPFRVPLLCPFLSTQFRRRFRQCLPLRLQRLRLLPLRQHHPLRLRRHLRPEPALLW